jgi:hypothetical protein
VMNRVALITMVMVVSLAGCASSPSPRTVAISTVDVDATVEARVRMTLDARPAASPWPTYTPWPTYIPWPTYTPAPTAASPSSASARPTAEGKRVEASETPVLAETPKKGTERIILSNSSDNHFNWLNNSPYVTTKTVFEGDIAFIPTGNNCFEKELGTIGYERKEIRYLTFKIYLLEKEAGLLVQALVGTWDHRWAFDGRPEYRGGYNWARQGQTANIPVGKWVTQELDLINDLGAKPGDKLTGLAFSGTDGKVIYDLVTLRSDK